MEKSNRKVIILKTYKAYHAYYDMIHYYAVKNLLAYMDANPTASFTTICNVLKEGSEHNWVNLGEQLIPGKDIDQLRSDIGTGDLSSWGEIHHRYNSLYEEYSGEKQKHAYAALCSISGTDNLTKKLWISALNRVVEIQEYISRKVYISRKKDFDNPFRRKTYRNSAEMNAAIGTIEDNSFVR